MSAALKILIVGGYGGFGGRLVRLLEDEPRLCLLVAGRNLEKARTYCDARRPSAKAQLVPVRFDRDGDAGAQLSNLKPDVVVDASGPFQSYGERPYRLVEACIGQKIHYLDLADGSDFVAGISAFDTNAREAGICVLTALSTFPVLTTAAVRELSRGLLQVTSIKCGVAPSPHAGVGENVIRAIAGYAGKPIVSKRDGALVSCYPLTEQMRFTIAPPGRLPLRSTVFSLVDVPDLRLLAELWPEAQTVWMGAGPSPLVLHRALIACAWLVRLRLVPSLMRLTPLMFFASNHFKWGEHRGGMFVEIKGVTARGEATKRSWNSLAEGDDGPFIPSMAVAAIIRKILAGASPASGARAATGELELDDYAPFFASRKIATGIREEPPRSAPLQARILGSAWEMLPSAIRNMHEVKGALRAEGRATVDRGRNIFSRMIGWLLNFPKEGDDIPVSVQFDEAAGTETWTRNFAGTCFSSRQFEGRGRSKHLLCERFGLVTFAMALVMEGEHLRLVLRRWNVLGVPLPMWLCPFSDAYESVEGNRFRFYVEIRMRFIGLIVRYRGWLVPSPAYSPGEQSAKISACLLPT
jgi:hypothetical protein